MSKPNIDICHLLMAQVINNSLLRLRPKFGRVEIPLLRFLADLNNMAHSYKELFQFTETHQLFDVEFLENTLKNSRFSNISCIKDDVLQLEVCPQDIQALLTSIIVDASIKRSKALIRDIDQLRLQYTTASSEPIIKVEPELPEPMPVEQLMQPAVVNQPLEDPGSDSTLTTVNEIQTDKLLDLQGSTLDNLQLRDLSSLAATDMYSETVLPSSNHDDQQDPAETQTTTSKGDSLPTNDTLEQINVKLEEFETSPGKDTIANEAQIDESSEDVTEVSTKHQALPQELPESIESEGGLETGNAVEETDSQEQDVIALDGQNTSTEEPSEILAIDSPEPPSINAKKEVSQIDPEEEGDDGPKRTRTRNQLAQKRSVSPLESQPPHKHKRFQSIAINLLRSIEGHRFSSPFLLPVTAPDYSDTVKEATDLKTIMKAVKSKQDPPVYETLKELERDIMLMFANCVMFNRSNTPIVDMAREMKSDVSQTFKMFEEAESNLNQQH